jgi:Rrf2 family cysteine metabolism transcriptional repressor
MKISTRIRYVTRALLDLAVHERGRPIQLKDIALRQEISVGYLEHLIAPLVSSGIVQTSRGPKGGVSLVRRPEEIRLSEIVEALEGEIVPVACVTNPEVCNRSEVCVTRDVWAELKRAIETVLESTTLRDLAERQVRKERTAEITYSI